jgi:hypothetical protein
MENLNRDVLSEIAKQIYYPTELINLVSVSKHFRFLGNNEHLFRCFWIREFQQFAPDFVLRLPENWTWKQVFIWLFKVKRQMISEMHAHMGLTYEHNFREMIGKGLGGLAFDDHLSNAETTALSLEERSLVPMHRQFLVEETVQENLDFPPDYSNLLELQDLCYFHENKISKSIGIYTKNRPSTKQILLTEGVCVWNYMFEMYIPIYPLSALREIFIYHKTIIMDEHNRKLRNAEKVLNESVYVEYKCNDINIENFYEYETLITDKLEEYDLGIIIFGYENNCLSLSITRYPKWKLFPYKFQIHKVYQIPSYNWKNERSEFDKTYKMCQFPIYNWENVKLDMKEVLEYSESCKDLYIPEKIEIEFLKEPGKKLTLELVTKRIVPPRIRHIKYDDVSEDPYNENDGDLGNTDANKGLIAKDFLIKYGDGYNLPGVTRIDNVEKYNTIYF